MRATTTPATPFRLPARRLRGLASGTAVAALALSLVPGSAVAAEADAVAVQVKVADQPAVAVATAPRVWPGKLLEAQGVPVDGNDLVKVVRDGRKVTGAKKRVREGDVVKMTDVEKVRKATRERLRPGTVEVFTTELKPGKRKVVREGRPGVRKVVKLKTLHNGEQVRSRVVKKSLVRDPRSRRVLVGRKPYSVPGTDGLNWGALASCESGGNPNAVNPAGYNGLYQFRPRHVAQRRGLGPAHRRLGRRADLPRQAALQAAWTLPLAELRPPALSSAYSGA